MNAREIVNRLRRAANLARGRALTDAIGLGIGTALAQVINFLVLLLVSRLYAPEAFGVFAVFSSIAWLLTVLATGQYEHLIMQLRTRRGAVHAATFVTLLAVFVALVTAAAVQASSTFAIAARMHIGSSLAEIGSWLSLTVLLIASNQALRYLALGSSRFRTVGLGVLTMSVVGGLATVLMAGDGSSATGLVIGQLAGYVANNAVLARAVRADVRGVRLNWRRAFRIGRLLLPKAASLTVAYGSRTAFGRLPTFIVATLGDERILGLYSLVERVLAVPTAVISRALSDVFRQRASQTWKQRGDLRALILRAVTFSAGVALPAYAIGVAIAPTAFALAFGEAWRSAGVMAQVLLIGEFFVFAGTPIESAAIVMGLHRYLMAWNVGRLLAKVALLLVVQVAAPGLAFVLWALVAARAAFYTFDFIFVLGRASNLPLAREQRV